MLTIAALLPLLLVVPTAASPVPAPPAAVTAPSTAILLDGYHDSAGLSAEADAIAAGSGGTATIVPIGTSRGGRPLIALRIGTPGDQKPAILVSAGLDGTHLCGSEVAVLVAKELLNPETLAKHPGLFDRATIWIIPRANPDALEATLAGPVPQRGTLRPVDDDRDGAIDEDPAKDLDGDGVITQMRVKNPPSPFVATLIADPAEARLLKRPESGPAAKSVDKPLYAVFVEGIDADGDGRIAEDGVGEVDLDHNFPHRYPEFARDAGPYQISEPESQALVRFVLAHPEIVAAITYGRHDSLVKVPENRDMDATGRTPLVHLPADIDLYQAIGKLYRETTGQARATGIDPAGSFWLWLADHRGMISLASTVWGRPDVPKDEKKPEGSSPDAKPDAKPDPKPDGAAPEAKVEPKTPSVSLGMIHDEEADEHALSFAGLQDAPPKSAPPSVPPQGGGRAEGQAAPPEGGRRRGQRGGGGGPPGGASGGGPAVAGSPPAGPAGAPGAPAASDEDAAQWLAYSDAVRNGAGFIAWHEVQHPLFGTVEVGGFHPLFRVNPPASELPELAKKQAAFLIELIERLPVIDVTPPTVTKVSDGVYRIESAVMNAGRLPTVDRMGVTTRARAPIVVRLSTPLDRIVSGDRVRKIDTLDPGERQTLEWIVRAPADETIELSVGNNEYGTQRFTIQNGVGSGDATRGSTK